MRGHPTRHSSPYFSYECRRIQRKYTTKNKAEIKTIGEFGEETFLPYLRF
jgi:hypothetical protein